MATDEAWTMTALFLAANGPQLGALSDLVFACRLMVALALFLLAVL